MTRIEWSKVGEKIFETGIEKVVFYPRFGIGVPWNGVTGITEKSEGGDITPYYKDSVKYVDFVSAEDFSATLEAFAAPPEFSICEGSRQLVPGLFVTQQPRQTFGLSYRTLIGNDLKGTDFGYKLHLVYGCTADNPDRTYSSIAELPTPGTRSWNITTVPQDASTYKPTAHFVFDTRYIDASLINDVETALYGGPDSEARLPDQAEILTIIGSGV